MNYSEQQGGKIMAHRQSVSGMFKEQKPKKKRVGDGTFSHKPMIPEGRKTFNKRQNLINGEVSFVTKGPHGNP